VNNWYQVPGTQRERQIIHGTKHECKNVAGSILFWKCLALFKCKKSLQILPKMCVSRKKVEGRNQCFLLLQSQIFNKRLEYWYCYWYQVPVLCTVPGIFTCIEFILSWPWGYQYLSKESSHRTSPPTPNPPPTEQKNSGDFVGKIFPTKSLVQWGVVMGVGVGLGVKILIHVRLIIVDSYLMFLREDGNNFLLLIRSEDKILIAGMKFWLYW
jgi:hypothetical protein